MTKDRLNQKTVLLVEDNIVLSEALAMVISKKYRLLTARTADEAILVVDAQLPDVILLDILLGGHSAFALLNELRSYGDTLSIPVIIFSDIANRLDQEALQYYGIRRILDKSRMKPGDLLLALESICQERLVENEN